jgi:hypothetical protein
MALPLLIQALYKSGLEIKVAEQLKDAGVSFEYEARVLSVLIPQRKARYTPDFCIFGSRIIIESKGYFYGKAKDRQKLILVKEQHPDIDLRLVFENANVKIGKGSATTYGKWATDHGFKWSDKGIVPDSWIKEMKGRLK